MTNRERVLTALNHKQPDKVPVSIGSTIVDGLTRYAKDAYEAFRNLPLTETRITHPAMQTAATPQWLRDELGMEFETVAMRSPFADSTAHDADGSYTDEFGIYWRKSSLYNDPVKGLLYGSITQEDILKNPWPDAYDKGRVAGLREEALKIQAKGDKILVADIMCGGPFEQSLWMRGWQDFLCDFYVDPVLAETLMDRITESAISFWDAYLGEIGDLVDIVCQGDDIGMQDRSIVSREMYDKYIKKYHKRLYDFIKSKTKAKIFMHSCGSVYDLLPGLIEAGVDILNPVQISARNMEPDRLKHDFGSELVFWGAIDTQHILPTGSAQEIRDCVMMLVETLGRDGGYVLAPGHNIQNYVEPWRIHAMVEAMKEARA
jgi:uroporphyrinogen decarboxylase